MKSGIAIILFILTLSGCNSQNIEIEDSSPVNTLKNYSPTNSKINYVGRVYYSEQNKVRFWNPGVYMQFLYEGDSCQLTIKDELPWPNSHNYITVVVDDLKEERIKLNDQSSYITIGKNLGEGTHSVRICKSTESGIGYIEIIGLRCQELVEPNPLPTRKIEFFGNSITCGTGSDNSVISCDSLEWHDKHNAYMSYGPLTARFLDAQWVLTSVSGIGMVHSCCDLSITMPNVYDKVNLQANQIE